MSSDDTTVPPMTEAEAIARLREMARIDPVAQAMVKNWQNGTMGGALAVAVAIAEYHLAARLADQDELALGRARAGTAAVRTCSHCGKPADGS